MPKKIPATLFGVPAKNLKWGVTPGGHVAHLIDPSEVENYTEITKDDMELNKYVSYKNDYKKVTQAEVYNNEGDNKTAEFFKRLAKNAEEAYNKPNATDEYKEVLLGIKDIVSASGRSAQQKAINEFNKKANKFLETNKDIVIDSELNITLAVITSLNDGALEVPKDYKYDKKDIKEPKDRSVGHFGIWTKTDEALFPHHPSPNDVKQGYGVNDCFLMSPLVYMADKHPDKIREAMRDNGDGTVSVRFWKNGKHLDSPKEPCYVTVNKTQNKLAGSSNVYASSALWVQVYEKAYIQFLNQHMNSEGLYRNSFSDIDYSFPDEVLNALDSEKNYGQVGQSFGFAANGLRKYYTPKADTNRPYLNNEEEMYNFLYNHVNVKKEPIMVGNSAQTKANKSFALDKGVRVEHVYSVLGVFEKDGKKYVQVRDPRALYRSKYDENGKLQNDQSAIMGTIKGGVGNMGTFNLELKDFHKVFDSINAAPEDAVEEFFDLAAKWNKEALAQEKAENDKKVEANKPSIAESFEDDMVVIGEDGEVEEYNAPAKDEKKGFADDFEEIDLDDEFIPNKANEALLNKLKQPGGFNEISTLVDHLATDLGSTSMFFSFKNTKKFTDMRDKLNLINKKIKDGKYSEKNPEALAQDLNDLAGLGSAYAEAKFNSIMENKAKGKEPSMRAMHRLTDAINLIRLGQGDTQIAIPENGFAESMSIIKNDITSARKKLSQDPASKNKLKHLDNAEEVLKGYLKKSPALKEQVARLENNEPKPEPKVKSEPVKSGAENVMKSGM